MNDYNKKLKQMGNAYAAGLALTIGGFGGLGLYDAFKKPRKGLKPPTKKSASKVVKRSLNRMNDTTLRNIRAEERRFPGASQQRFDKHQKSLDRLDRLFTKTLPKVVKTMGAVGTIASIMKPKPAGAGSDFTPAQIKAMLDKKK